MVSIFVVLLLIRYVLIWVELSLMLRFVWLVWMLLVGVFDGCCRVIGGCFCFGCICFGSGCIDC